ncbi:epidermal growth factor receptor kinase substrate 8-like isoform X3 [Limulus polyphemus]|uniref:Epidermal growth factor receptor kinase substrate 8-like isoform X3 n=1 Tax=Limulus polyphemus TaxID=6850 RepID=A0ABM1TKJ1_LIMPO|nr:epidermal growth factor receptor kinase substrate 8-like isoform X3 [Limulus polyphemus]
MSPHHMKDPEMRGARSSYSNGYSSDQHSDTSDDGPAYLVEHLATFSVGPQFGLETPKDGLRRLFQMEKTNGIWTQKMQMKLDKRWLVIIDYENGDVVEKFPMNLISDPTDFTSRDPKELYNNIVIFIVVGDPKHKDHNPSEMHIFQSLQVSAHDVVADMKLFMTGKWKPGYRSDRRSIPPPPANSPPEPPLNGISVREQVDMFNASVKAHVPSSPAPHGLAIHQERLERADRSENIRSSLSRASNDETSSTTSERYERDVTMLNHCFDDIERFIARLQHAAAAFKELERRQKSRKSKKKDLGDGMLSMRAKPPPEREFLDILQKFKLSFNLLARLRNHIHEPNAPELVHFLFTPLTVIVEAARDSNYGPNIADKVIAPLLTGDAIDLLKNCCTSKESDLWYSLGETWIVPRELWKGYEGNFRPVFGDGWAPEISFVDERERSELNAPVTSSVIQRTHQEDVRRSNEEEFRRPLGLPSDQESHYDSDFFYRSERRGERDPQSVPPNHPPSAFDNRHYETQHLSVPGRGERHSSSERDFRDTRSDVSADSIEQGIDPQQQFERHQQRWMEELKASGAKIVVVLYPRTANNDKELSVVRGEVLEVLDDSRKWWRARNYQNQVGHVPHTIVTPYQAIVREEETINNRSYPRGGPVRETYQSQGSLLGGRDRLEEGSHRGSQGSVGAPAPPEWIQRERRDSSINAPSPSSFLSEELSPVKVDVANSPPLTKQQSNLTDTATKTTLTISAKPMNVQEKYSDSPYYVTKAPLKGKESDDGTPPSSLLLRTEQKVKGNNADDTPLVLSSFTTEIKRVKNEKLKTRSRSIVKQNNQQLPRPNTPPSAPNAPPAPPLPTKPFVVKKKDVSVPRDAHDCLKKELYEHVTLGCNTNKKWGKINLNHWDGLYITAESKPVEVQEWLESKDFVPKIRDLFNGMTGKMMFKLTRSRLEEVLGNEEGGRLHSHLTVQKNISGYKTFSSRELQAILAERRRKIESTTDDTFSFSQDCNSDFNDSTLNSDSGVSIQSFNSDISNQGSDSAAKEHWSPRKLYGVKREKEKPTLKWQQQQLLAQALTN